MDVTFHFPHDIMQEIVSKMPLLDMFEFAKTSIAAYDIVRKELRSRHGRMLERFLVDPRPLLDLMRRSGSIISGSFALHYMEGDGRFVANDLDLYTPHDQYTEVVEFFKGLGYREHPKKDDLSVIRYPRMFRRTKALLTGVKSVTSLTNGKCKVDVIQVLSPLPVFALIHFWSTLQMNYLSADGFCSLYPQLTFSGVGLLTPVALNAVTIPRYPVIRLIKKYQARGYHFVTRQDSLDNQTFQLESIPVTHDPKFVESGESSRPDTDRGLGDGRSFTLTYGTLDVPYKIGSSLQSEKWRVGWKLGGMWAGNMWPSKAITFNAVTGRHVDLYVYLKDMAQQEEAQYAAEVADVV